MDTSEPRGLVEMIQREVSTQTKRRDYHLRQANEASARINQLQKGLEAWLANAAFLEAILSSEPEVTAQEPETEPEPTAQEEPPVAKPPTESAQPAEAPAPPIEEHVPVVERVPLEEPPLPVTEEPPPAQEPPPITSSEPEPRPGARRPLIHRIGKIAQEIGEAM